jgi:hypothetical protein
MRKLMSLVVVGGMSLLPHVVLAQSGTVGAGETIPVRITDSVSASQADGRIFRGTVDSDVQDSNGRIAIPAGSAVELTARNASSDTLALDLESVTVNGQRYAVAGSSEASTSNSAGIGANKKTATYVGGGAILGTILGAVVGGGKGAAIGAVAGGAAGAGAQVITKGHSLNVPSGTVVSFRLDRAMSVGVRDSGFSRNGNHYHRVN